MKVVSSSATENKSSFRCRQNPIGRKCGLNRLDCYHCKGGVNKGHENQNIKIRKSLIPIWTRDGIKKWLDKSFNQEHFSMIEDLKLGEEAKIVNEDGSEVNNNDISNITQDLILSPLAPPPSEDSEEVEDVGKLASQMERMEFTGTKVKEQQPFENTFDKQLLEHINNELNKTFSSESVWTRDSISSWLDEAKSETWSMVDLVQEMETRSANDVVSNSLSLNLDAKPSEGTSTDTNVLSINDHQMNWNEDL